MELLASHGIIAGSIDCNFLNGNNFGENDGRAIVHLEHVKQFKAWNSQPSHPLFGKVDLSRVLILGHSRGGEAVGHASYFNTLTSVTPDPGGPVVPLDGSAGLGPYDFSLAGALAIAPTDGQYTPVTGATRVTGNYVLIHGSRDGDVRTFPGHNTLDRSHPVDSDAPANDAPGFKALLWIIGANHNFFNSVWDSEGSPTLTRAEQENVAKVFIGAVAQGLLLGRAEQLRLVKDHRLAWTLGFIPATIRRRALVVLATGLGKTWLAAFDVDAFRAERRRLPRVLFLAHRSELLEQAAETFRRLFRHACFSWCAGARDDLGGDLVFASAQKLSRPASLERLQRELTDAGAVYVVVDEVHHATAASYRRILGRIDPDFLLGLTATPDRADQADVVGLFDDNLPYRADLGAGIVEGLLAPFAYHGLRDVVDYANISWRNRRFDPDELARAAQTQARMERLWQAWTEHPARRSLVFCCSIAHAEFVRQWLEGRGVRVAAVHSEPGSADRETALDALERSELGAVCSVDLFNEGIDVPNVDRLVMLRPTESPVVFLQQLGRALRRAAGKERLGVIEVHVARVRPAVPRPRRAAVDGLGGRRLRQRDVRELLCHARVRAVGSPPLHEPGNPGDPGPGGARGAQTHLGADRRGGLSRWRVRVSSAAVGTGGGGKGGCGHLARPARLGHCLRWTD